MPAVSKAQNAAMHAAAAGKSTLGIPKRVGQDFVNATHGMKVSRLPERVVHVHVHLPSPSAKRPRLTP